MQNQESGEDTVPTVTMDGWTPRTGWVLLWGAVATLAVPPAVFLFCALTGGMPVGTAITALVEQYQVSRNNLLMCGILGLFPVLLLAVAAWGMSRLAGPVRAGLLTFGGMTGIVLILVWVNFQFWPSFLPDRVNPGWPHGLEFVIGPLFFAPVAMLVGILMAGLVMHWSRSR